MVSGSSHEENNNRLLTVFIILGMIAAPAAGLSVSSSTEDAGGAATTSTTYSLDDSSSIDQRTVLAGSEISQTDQAGGTGNNSLTYSVGSNGCSANSEVDSSGSMNVFTTVSAADGRTGISQSAALSGISGSVNFVASSNENQMGLVASFFGDSNMKTDLSADASDSACMTGTASIAGVPVLEGGELEQVASGEIGMSVDGLYAQPSGDLGQFSLSTINVKNPPESGTPSYLTAPAYTSTSTGGNTNSYLKTGWRWNIYNPKIQWYLKSNTVPSNINVQSAATAVLNAATTWNSASNQKLFNPVVYYTSAVSTDTYDRKNVVAWKYLYEAPTALAYSRTWYNYLKVGGYYTVVESDISLNTRYPWSTSLPDGKAYVYGDSIDVQSVVLHEMGHPIGLGDIYGNTPYASDTKQIMNSYRGVKRTLGNGDKTGVWLLYK